MASLRESQKLAEGFLDGAQIFMNLLQDAAMGSGQGWNKQRLESTFSWAAYMKKVADGIETAGAADFRNAFESKLREMGKDVLPFEADMNLLKNGQDFFVEGLILNSGSSGQLLNDLFTIIEDPASGVSVHSALGSRASAIKARQAYNQVFDQLQSAEDWLKVKSQEAGSAMLETAAEVEELMALVRPLVFKLAVWWDACHLSPWFNFQLSGFLTRLSQSPGGWSVVVACFCVDLSRVERREMVRQLLGIVLVWLHGAVQNTGHTCLWSVKRAVMSRAAEGSWAFCQWLLNTLEGVADRLEEKRDGQGYTLMQLANPNNQQCSAEDRSVEELQRRFFDLLTTDSDIKARVLGLLTLKSKNKMLGVWASLSRGIIHMAGLC